MEFRILFYYFFCQFYYYNTTGFPVKKDFKPKR